MPSKSATVGIKIEAEATDALRDVSKAEAALDALGQAAKQAGTEGSTGLSDLERAITDVQKTSDEASQAAGGISDALKAGLAGGAAASALSGLQDMVLGAFSKIADKASELWGEALDFEVGRDKLQAQLGLTAEQAAKMGALAGQLYSQAYGENMEQVNEALRLVTQNVGLSADTQSEQLKSVTGSVLDLATAFDQDLGGVTRAVGQMIKTGLAANAEEALDILTVGFQKGNDKAEDLLDTINEYSTLFRALGIDGKIAMGLLSQGLQAGARDTDQIADALGAFAELSKTASETTKQAYKDMGLDAEKMLKVFGKGGPEAAAGLDLVLDSLRAMEDPVKRNEVAVALFGDKANELQAALFALDPSQAVDALGQVTGAAGEMGTALADNAATKVESFKRSIETGIVNFLADTVIPKLEELAPKAQEIMDNLAGAWEAFKRGFTGEKPELGGSITAVENMEQPGDFKEFEEFGETVRKMSDEWVPRLQEALKRLGDEFERLWKFVNDNREALILIGAVILGVVAVPFLQLLGIIIMVQVAITVLTTIVNTLRSVVGWLADRFTDAWRIIGDAVFGAINFIGPWLGNLASMLVGLWLAMDSLKTNVERIWGAIGDAIMNTINRITQPIRDLIDLIGRVPVISSIAGLNAHSVAVGPVAMTTAMAAPTSQALAGSSTTINVSVSHTGLGVDSPRLQRDIVEAIRRYERRNGSRYVSA